MGVVNAFDIPARQSFLVEMVGREDLMNAIALNSSMFNGARIIGPAIAGILVASIGEGWCFFANAVSYIAVIAGLLMMEFEPAARPRPQTFAVRTHRRRIPLTCATPRRSCASCASDRPRQSGGDAVLRADADLRGPILHGDARTLGVLMGAAGVGALTGALSGHAPGVRGLGRWVVDGLRRTSASSLILFSFSRWYWLSVVLLVPVGFAMMIQMAASNTLIQAMVPDRLRGRTMAVYSMMFMGMAPLGALLCRRVADASARLDSRDRRSGRDSPRRSIFCANLPRIRVRRRGN